MPSLLQALTGQTSWFANRAGLSQAFVLSVALALPVPAIADTIWMKNGDRLTGTIKFLDGGKVLLTTGYGGTVSVDLKAVETLQSDQKLLVAQDVKHAESVQSVQASSAGKVILSDEKGERSVELTGIQQMIKPKPLIQDLTVTGNADIAMDFKRADTNTDDYNLAVKIKARHGDWRHNATGEFNRESQDDVITTDNWQTEYALDRFLDDHLFWQGRLDYKNDKIESLERQRTVGTGPGYQFWDDELGAFSLTSLLNRSDYLYSDDTMVHFYSLAMKWDYNRYLIGKTVQLFTSGELGRPLDNTATYSLDTNIGLRYKVTEWASLNLKAEKDDVSGTANSDLHTTRYTAGVGVTW